MHSFWQARRLLLAIALIAGGGVAVWHGAADYRSASSEKAPTVLSIEALDGYDGQRWLTIQRGVLLTDQAVIRDLPRQPGAREDLATFYVPMVRQDWRPTNPVHVICKLGPGRRATIPQWLKENGGGSLHSFTGVVADEPPGLYFPGLVMGRPAILLHQGGKLPDPTTSIAIIGLGVLLFVAGVGVALWLVRDARARAADKSQP